MFAAGIYAHVTELGINLKVKFLSGNYVWIYRTPPTYLKNATSIANIPPFIFSAGYFLLLGKVFGLL